MFKSKNKPKECDKETNRTIEPDQRSAVIDLPKYVPDTVCRSTVYPKTCVLNVAIEPTRVGYNPTSIEYTVDGSLWMCKYLSNVIRRKEVDKPFATFRMNDAVRDIAVHPTTYHLYCLKNGFSSFNVGGMDTTTGNTIVLFEVKQTALSKTFVCIICQGRTVWLGGLSGYRGQLSECSELFKIPRENGHQAKILYSPRNVFSPPQLPNPQCVASLKHINITLYRDSET